MQDCISGEEAPCLSLISLCYSPPGSVERYLIPRWAGSYCTVQVAEGISCHI